VSLTLGGARHPARRVAETGNPITVDASRPHANAPVALSPWEPSLTRHTLTDDRERDCSSRPAVPHSLPTAPSARSRMLAGHRCRLATGARHVGGVGLRPAPMSTIIAV